MSYTKEEFNYYVNNPLKISDRLDEDLKLSLLKVNASWFKYMKPHTLDLIKRAITINPTTFEYADSSVFTIQFLEEIINQYPLLIQYVYEPNLDLIKIALNKDLNTIQYFKKLPNSIKASVLSQNGLMLKHIPITEQTAELVEIAIRENIEAYKFSDIKSLELDKIILEIDPKRIDLISEYHPDLLSYIIDYNPRFISIFLNKENEVISDEILKRAIDKDSSIFKMIKNPSMEITKYAVTKDLSLINTIPYNQDLLDYMLEINGLVLEYFKKKDLRTIKKAIDQNVEALKFVKYKRQFLIDYAFTLDGLAIQFIENPTQEQYEDAVFRNGYAIQFIPDEKQNKKIQTYALSGAGTFAIPYIKHPVDIDIALEIIRKEPAYIFKLENPSNKMLMVAFSISGQLILFFDNWEERFNTDIIKSALIQDGTILEKVKNKTKSLVLAAIESYPAAIQWYENQDLEIAKAAVEKDPRVLFFVKRSIMDEELLDLAHRLYPDLFQITQGEMTWEDWLKLHNNG